MYDFYIDEYEGTAIPDIVAFSGVIHEAKAYVDNLCVNRENLKYEPVRRKYNMAVCAAAECIFQSVKSSSQKQSESVGNHSVSYRVLTQSEYEAEKRKKVLTFLYGTGLMYSAM